MNKEVDSIAGELFDVAAARSKRGVFFSTHAPRTGEMHAKPSCTKCHGTGRLGFDPLLARHVSCPCRRAVLETAEHRVEGTNG